MNYKEKINSCYKYIKSQQGDERKVTLLKGRGI